MKQPFIADAASGGSAKPTPQVPGGKPQSDKDRIAELESSLAIANNTITSFEADQAQRAKDEAAIAAKTRLGLSRDQAIAVIARQKAHDAAEEAKRKAA